MRPESAYYGHEIVAACTSLADGPVVLDYPAGATAGGVLGFWQRPVTDMGLTGPDQGKGGRFVVFWPGDDPAEHANVDGFAVRSETVRQMPTASDDANGSAAGSGQRRNRRAAAFVVGHLGVARPSSEGTLRASSKEG